MKEGFSCDDVFTDGEISTAERSNRFALFAFVLWLDLRRWRLLRDYLQIPCQVFVIVSKCGKQDVGFYPDYPKRIDKWIIPTIVQLWPLDGVGGLTSVPSGMEFCRGSWVLHLCRWLFSNLQVDGVTAYFGDYIITGLVKNNKSFTRDNI